MNCFCNRNLGPLNMGFLLFPSDYRRIEALVLIKKKQKILSFVSEIIGEVVSSSLCSIF